MDAEDPSPQLVADLQQPSAWPWPAERIELVETHISWVFLAGEYACKFKKPLDLGFLDFRERERRRHYCEEELRLNRRLAPELYLDLVGARPTPGGWRVGAAQPQAEPAVRMRRFADDARLDRRLEAGRLEAAELEDFARALANFQRELPPARPGEGFGDATAVPRPALANFHAFTEQPPAPELADALRRLEAWTRQRAAALAPRFDARLAAGFVREGHGDLHLANLVRLADRVAAFDGIEFDPALRWIDVQSEVAFLLMDLESRVRPDLGWRFYNAWLAALGDYDGIALLPWYLVYRHLVRAKVDGIRLAQPGLAPQEAARLRARRARHVELAAGHADPPPPLLVLTSGYSGSGKSRLAARLAARLPAIWVRSDLERKRLHGLNASAPAPAGVGEGLYSADSSERTYARLAEIADTALSAGCSVIVDAAFLEAARRDRFVELGLAAGARPAVLVCEAPPAILRARVAARRSDPSDADLAVLEAQLARPAESGTLEGPYRYRVDTGDDPELESLAASLHRGPSGAAHDAP
jgi:uncharacterized protein